MTAKLLRPLLRALLPVLPLLAASCTMVPELGALADRGGTRHRKIVVSLGEQKAYLYQYDKLMAVAPISSGREGSARPPAASP